MRYQAIGNSAIRCALGLVIKTRWKLVKIAY
jgi:hypothetical protein